MSRPYPTGTGKIKNYWWICNIHHCLISTLGIPTPGKEVIHDDVIKWKHFPRHWPFVRGIHRSLVNSPHKGQWRRALMFSLICALINDEVNNWEAGDLRRHRAHYHVTVMISGRGPVSVLLSWRLGKCGWRSTNSQFSHNMHGLCAI